MKITFRDFTKIFLRFINRNPKYYGTVTVKFYNGEIVHLTSEDSFDVKVMGEDFINFSNGENNMFVKRGAPNIKDKDSSKIISQVEVDEENKIVKESKLVKEEKVEEKEKVEEIKN